MLELIQLPRVCMSVILYRSWPSFGCIFMVIQPLHWYGTSLGKTRAGAKGTQLGGATAGVGDPTGRSTARIQSTRDVRLDNTRYIDAQIQRLWKNVAILAEKHLTEIPKDMQRDGKVLNNDDWLSKISIMDVLSTIGSGLRLGPLLGRDTYVSAPSIIWEHES